MDFVASIEVALARATITEEEELAIRHKVTTRLMNTTKLCQLSPSEMQAVKRVNSDETTIILLADKGRVTVIDTIQYT